ncbi:MAG TPA: hypothetical protein PLZ74_10765, partial [Kiritimatiellia bacterium]|nr:hypothetical protein [Kiritimatiellia bacterium]
MLDVSFPPGTVLPIVSATSVTAMDPNAWQVAGSIISRKSVRLVFGPTGISLAINARGTRVLFR